jgi:ABC-type antimicrobial peptide transport system permease subunit
LVSLVYLLFRRALALAFVGGVAGVLFVGLSTVVVQAMSSDEIRARALAIWPASRTFLSSDRICAPHTLWGA